jgi:hypothetical protein
VQLALQLAFWGVGLPLILMVIAAMWRGPYKEFPVLFVYVIAVFLLTVAGLPAYFDFYFKHSPDARTRMADWNFWNDLIIETLIYAVVISLIYKAASHFRSRRIVLTGIIGGAILIAAISFVVHFERSALRKGVWMTPIMLDLSFVSEILDLGLWALLISRRKRDTRLLLVTGGLGIQFTGEAIGDSLRSMALQRHSRGLSYTGSFLITVADLTALYIFWQAFRHRHNPTPQTSTVGSGGGTAERDGR